MLPSETRYTRLILTRFASMALACALATGMATGTVIPAAASTEDVGKHAAAAKQAAKALEKAKAKADKSAAELDKASERATTATDELDAAEKALDVAKAQLDQARAISTTHAEKVSVARIQTASLYREEGLVDVAAEVARVATGESDNVVLDAASTVVKAGLTGVVGPVLGLLDPLRDAVQGHIDEATRAFEQAEQREQAVGMARIKAIHAHRAAAVEVTETEAELRAARSSLKKATAAEEEATDQKAKDAKAVKSAKSEAEEAKAAEKKAKQKAAEGAERAGGRSAAASSQSRSVAVGSKVMPGTGGINSRYGMRTHPITGAHKLHTGTDFGYGDGNAYAASAGTVAEVTYDSAYGNMVTLSHGRGVQTRYAHLSGATVSVGQQVAAGDLVGKIGSTGMSTGAHLHFEVLVGGDFVNPESWLSG